MLPILPRIVITWLAIFPLVVVCRLLVTRLLPGWPDLAQTAIVMAVVVPVAVLWAVPLLTRGYVRMTRASVAKGEPK